MTIELVTPELFEQVRFFTGPVPSYPGGLWSYVILSDAAPAETPAEKYPSSLKYFNRDIMKAAFALPTFMRRAVK